MFGYRKKDPRLEHWTDRRRCLPGDGSGWAWLRRPPTLLRLGLVLATAGAVALVIFLWGPAMPYRLGEVLAADVRVRVGFAVLNVPRTERLREEAAERAGADAAARAAAAQAVAPAFDVYPTGVPLAQRGDRLTERQLDLLLEEHRAYCRSLTSADHLRRGVALILIVNLLAGLIVLYVVRLQPTLAQSLPRLVGICLLVLATVALGLALSQPPWHATTLPLTLAAMILTIVCNPPFALLMSFSLALVMSLALGGGIGPLLVMMAGLATAVLLLRNVCTRTRLVEVAAGSGIAYVVMTVATELLAQQTWAFIGWDAGRHLVLALLAGCILSGGLPLVERSFGVVTDIRLMELADGSHPLLQELVRRAPGTYTHSMTVATLAEAAAEAIGANPLIVRVGSYFHDIGKMLKPHYFIENQTGENRHDDLEPALSTLVIIGHVKDGLALARRYHLPRPILDAIEQHHGTTLVEYFYREALRLQSEQGYLRSDLEPAFRYPGPKPRSREVGIVMLADAAESSSRALIDPSPASLRKLVHDLTMKRLLDGQFDESGLTLTELHRIEESLCKSLIALYHSRIRYPESEIREHAG
ncbi:MAG: HDIG domain-containing protein [Gemmataceae bacterium]|nr:HDIG domain-containing protein [Gemmataceae bacterium]MDW8263997.1 HDIG domain-containing protein [Gemmataceae bacterium]